VAATIPRRSDRVKTPAGVPASAPRQVGLASGEDRFAGVDAAKSVLVEPRSPRALEKRKFPRLQVELFRGAAALLTPIVLEEPYEGGEIAGAAVRGSQEGAPCGNREEARPIHLQAGMDSQFLGEVVENFPGHFAPPAGVAELETIHFVEDRVEIRATLRQPAQQVEKPRVSVLHVVREHDEHVEVRLETLQDLVVKLLDGVEVGKIEQDDALEVTRLV
jgi:hypothetical protein